MCLLAKNCWWNTRTEPSIISQKLDSPHHGRRMLHAPLCSKFGVDIRAFPSRDSAKKLSINLRARKHVKSQSTKSPLDKFNGLAEKRPSPSDVDLVEGNNGASFSETSTASSSVSIPSRSAVLKACAATSGLIASLGVIIRQVSHVASTEGWPILDCSTEVSFQFEMWHLELITGLIILISSCRYLLTRTWPDFAESSEAANQQVLSSLEPLDYIIVAFLPGISEELLFRGALLPLFGADWKSAFGVAALFGLLHLGGGRKYSFVVWATFVGLVYGYATIASSSMVVPMASHVANNLVGGLLWRYSSKSSK